MHLNKDRVSIPALLKSYEAELIRHQRRCVAIEAHPQDGEPTKDPLSLTASKFLGRPFLPADREYPMDESGHPMALLAQINFAEVPPLPGFPTSGLLQLYISVTDWYDVDSEKVLYHSNEALQKPPRHDLPFIDDKLYDELPIFKIHQLQFTPAIDTGNSEDSQFSLKFGDKAFWEFEEDLSESDQQVFDKYFSTCGHKIGGYAMFTQTDPRSYNDQQKDDIQLLQIDVDDFIMFGDGGLGHLFISPEALKSGDLEQAYFYWDCY